MTPDPLLPLARRAAAQMLARLGDPALRLRLWDGSLVGPPEDQVHGTVHIRDRAALLRIVLDPELQPGDLYVEGRVRIEGDSIGVLRSLFRHRGDAGLLTRMLPRRLVQGVLNHDRLTARRSARHHYDVGNDFYALWLDERMVYTCAYFPSRDLSLEEAQVAKMEHVCRKLALRPGEHVIEAGSGWGSLALHMARYHGVTVQAWNVSHEQVLYAREQAEKQGLADRVEFVEDDYREIRGRCDAFASVGMLEHVGPTHYRQLGEVIDRVLAPAGRGLIHSIGRSRPMSLHRWTRTRVFPNAHPPTLGEMMEVFEPRDLAVLDVENLRLHYALTARRWHERFQANRARIDALVEPWVARTWELYLAGTAASFESATCHLYQVVFSRAANDAIPWTRAHLYGDVEDGFGAAAGEGAG